MKTRNITLALPESVLRRLKAIAAQQETSISALLTRELERLAEGESGYASAHKAMMADLRRGYSLGTGGRITRDRESLHER